MGKHSAWAATGMRHSSIAWVSFDNGVCGNRSVRAFAHRFAKSTRPSVASAESANPALTASHGSHMRSSVMAAPSAGQAAFGLPHDVPSKPTMPIAPARTTLGSGWHTST